MDKDGRDRLWDAYLERKAARASAEAEVEMARRELDAWSNRLHMALAMEDAAWRDYHAAAGAWLAEMGKGGN